MGLLDGGLQRLVGKVFSPMFLAGQIHTLAAAPDGYGGFTRTTTSSIPVKLALETYSERDRADLDIPVGDMRLIILQHDVPIALTLDHEVSVTRLIAGSMVEERYTLVGAVTQDPAAATWIVQGRPRHG